MSMAKVRRTKKWFIWGELGIISLLIVLRYMTFVFPYVASQLSLQVDSYANEPTVISIAAQVGGSLALVLSIAGLVAYFLFCLFLDSSLLQGVMNEVPFIAYIGPCLTIATLAVLPVQAISLAARILFPRDYVVTVLWVAFVCLGSFVLYALNLRRNRAGFQSYVILFTACVATSLISFLF